MNRRTLLLTALGAILLATPIRAGSAIEESPLYQLRQRIITANLINGLYLSTEQMETLLQLGRRLELEQRRLSAAEDRYSRRAQALLERYLQNVLENEEPDPELLAEVRRRVTPMLGRHREVLERIGEEVWSCLNESQRYTIQIFKPCLVPQAAPGDGPPIGAAALPDQPLARVFLRARELPARRYRIMRRRAADRFVEHLERQYSDDLDLEEARRRFLRALDRARTLSETELHLQLPELIEEAMPPEEFQPRLPRAQIQARAARWLLSPEAQEVLRFKLEQQP
jgi:hypothetical protein